MWNLVWMANRWGAGREDFPSGVSLKTPRERAFSSQICLVYNFTIDQFWFRRSALFSEVYWEDQVMTDIVKAENNDRLR